MLSVIVIVLIAAFNITAIDKSKELILEEGNWTYYVEDESVVVVNIEDDNHITMNAKHDDHTFIHFQNTEGTEKIYYVTVSGGSIWIDIIDGS